MAVFSIHQYHRNREELLELERKIRAGEASLVPDPPVIVELPNAMGTSPEMAAGLPVPAPRLPQGIHGASAPELFYPNARESPPPVDPAIEEANRAMRLRILAGIAEPAEPEPMTVDPLETLPDDDLRRLATSRGIKIAQDRRITRSKLLNSTNRPVSPCSGLWPCGSGEEPRGIVHHRTP